MYLIVKFYQLQSPKELAGGGRLRRPSASQMKDQNYLYPLEDFEFIYNNQSF